MGYVRIFCAKCGMRNPASAVWCGHCGATLPAARGGAAWGESLTLAGVVALCAFACTVAAPVLVIAVPEMLGRLLSAVGLSEATPVATAMPARVMYFCGYDRCLDSLDYGKLVFPGGIRVWNGPDPDWGGLHHRARHGERVGVIRQKRVRAGPGGLWFELEGGGWTNDLWLTENVCSHDNLVEYTFAACLGRKY
jgi:hypothetical protein